MENQKTKPLSIATKIHVPAKEFLNTTQLNNEELEMFKTQIMAEISETKQTHSLIEGALQRHHNDNDDNWPTFKFSEDTVDVFTKKEIASHACGLTKYISQLEFSLKQIDNKTFGICCLSGEAITKERLLHFPQSVLSEATKKKIALQIQTSS
jgi:DnaK suppressor protein